MDNQKEILQKIEQALIGLEEDRVDALVKEALDLQIPPLAIINSGLVEGLRKMGAMFEKGELFIPHLMVAAEIVEKNSDEIKPLLATGEEKENRGTVLIGTVEGDIHDLGKNLVGTMLSIGGFNVIDLGKDVPCEVFFNRVESEKANFLFLSALMTTTMTRQEEMIQMLKDRNIRDHVKIAIGGAPVTMEWADRIGADGYARDAVEAVKMAEKLLE